MDVHSAVTEKIGTIDPRSLLAYELEQTRIEREQVQSAFERDHDRLKNVRSGLDALCTLVWRDIYSQHQTARMRENAARSLTLGWFGDYAAWAGFAVLLVCIAGYLGAGVAGAFAGAGLYVALAVLSFFAIRGNSVGNIKKLRKSLGKDGKDFRFVTFTDVDHTASHPFIGYDGPLENCELEERVWKIPGIADKDAASEVFLEVMDERPNAVILSRFPDKTPTLVHAEVDNPFVKVYGVYMQRAIERQLPLVKKHAVDFRAVATRFAKLKSLQERATLLERELEEFDHTVGVLDRLPIADHAKRGIARNVSLFRLGDREAPSGLLICGPSDVEKNVLAKTIAEAAGARFIPLAAAEMRTGYVGQGAAYVIKCFTEAREAGRAIVFIDDCELILGKRGYVAFGPMRNEIHAAIVNEWEALRDSGTVWLVGGTDRPELIDQTAVLRFGTIVDLSRPEPAAAHSAIEEADARAARASWDDLTISSPVRDRLHSIASMLAHWETLQEQGIEIPRVVLLYGPAGNGKADIARAFAKEAGLATIDVSPEDAVVGFERAAEHAPAIVSIEHLDAVPGESAADVAACLDRLADMRLFVVSTSSEPERIDATLQARLQEIVEISNPDGFEREALLKQLLAGKPFAAAISQRLDELAECAAGKSRQELRTMVQGAIRRAAVRAIEAGAPDSVAIAPGDFGVGMAIVSPNVAAASSSYVEFSIDRESA